MRVERSTINHQPSAIGHLSTTSLGESVSMNSRILTFEQAVYGSFPFWDKGYALLARSADCRPEWLSDFQKVCQGYGESARDGNASGAMFCLRLPSGPWAVVGVEPQGNDDHGRPGALAFHGLLVTPREFRKAGFDPFVLAEALQKKWGPDTTFLPTGSVYVEWPPGSSDQSSDEARRISRALSGHRRVALESSAPIDELARSVWRLLPVRVRKRASLATLAFGNANQFDLIALPRLESVVLDDSYVGPPNFGERVVERNPDQHSVYELQLPRHWWAWLAGAVLSSGILAFVLWKAGRDSGSSLSDPPARVDTIPPLDVARPPETASSADERTRVMDSLVDLAERFHVLDVNERAPDSPAKLMLRISETLRYRGPALSPARLARLRAEDSEGKERALAMHAHISHYLPDHPLPEKFSNGNLRYQLVTLAWSFHVNHDTRRPPTEIPAELEEALAVPFSARTGKLITGYPEVAEYEKFLRRLPRR
jgi:hypothetical protein